MGKVFQKKERNFFDRDPDIFRKNSEKWRTKLGKTQHHFNMETYKEHIEVPMFYSNISYSALISFFFFISSF